MSATVSAMKKVKLRSDLPPFLEANHLNKRICEVGVRFGYNLQTLLAANPELLVGVDHYAKTDNLSQQDTGMNQGQLNELYRDVFTRFLSEPAVRIYRGTSAYAAGAFPLYYFDFIYLDADHSYEGARNDLRAWWGRVRQGGILAGHDFVETSSKAGTSFGVIKAVREFMEEKRITEDCFHHTHPGFRTWMIFKLDGE